MTKATCCGDGEADEVSEMLICQGIEHITSWRQCRQQTGVAWLEVADRVVGEFRWFMWVLDTSLKVALFMLTLAKICHLQTEKQVKKLGIFRMQASISTGNPI